MRRIVLIGGTGAGVLVPAPAASHAPTATPYGPTSGPLREWQEGDVTLLYLPRHGVDGATAPHLVNYRANIWALRELQPECVIGINAVGGITAAVRPGCIVTPDQLIDYTWGREHTFCDRSGPVRHVEFDPPFSAPVRQRLLAAASGAGLEVVTRGVYGVTQGPRLETAAEIDRLAADGCDIVGMTAMPEAGLARELDLAYAICAVVVNRAAGRLPPGGTIHADLARFTDEGMAGVRRLIETFIRG